jgi:DNA-binding transcriptional LysR family regulator
VVVHTRINTVVATTHWSSIYELVKRGIGIGVLQAPACMKEISNGEMVELLPGYHIPAFDLHALTPPQKPISPTINQVISFLKTTVPSLLAQYHASAINIRRG